MTRFRHGYNLILLGGCAALLWVTGLVFFALHIQSLNVEATHGNSADAIVVLTGGSERLAAGLELLKAGKGKKLLVTGVHAGLTLDRLPVSHDLYSCCITLGHEAASTFGNAEETRSWMQEQNFHSLILVTANYHMARSLMIFHTFMPDIVIVPNPVQPDSVKLEQWWSHSGTASLLVTEYNKFLWAALRLGLRG